MQFSHKIQFQETNTSSSKQMRMITLEAYSSKLIFYFLSLNLFALVLFFASCSNNNSEEGQIITKDNAPTNLLEGRWRATIGLGSEDLPFNFDITEEQDGKLKMTIINAEERIEVEDITFTDDSVYIKLPVFNSELKGKWHPMRIIGEWHDYARGDDYQLSFYARHNDSTRFDMRTVNDPTANIKGRWEGMFIAKDRSGKDDAIGEFKQNGEIISGTFMTPTGDYRYLEGLMIGNENEPIDF